jgi:hypothetical protein
MQPSIGGIAASSETGVSRSRERKKGRVLSTADRHQRHHEQDCEVSEGERFPLNSGRAVIQCLGNEQAGPGAVQVFSVDLSILMALVFPCGTWPTLDWHRHAPETASHLDGVWCPSGAVTSSIASSEGLFPYGAPVGRGGYAAE